jgi:(p)ppGpp synthase/HD superfamily hydrolase
MADRQKSLSNRIDFAFALAHRIHRQQARKGTEIPYLAHLLGVTAIVLEYGGDENEAIAALLHDAIEDAPPEIGVQKVRDEIRQQFGDDVLEIVEHCTDTDVQPKPPWRARKAAYVAAIEHAPAMALRVSAADKLHNVQSLIRDYRSVGDELWPRFNPEAGKAGILWYYRALANVFNVRMPGALADDLDRAVRVFEELTG